MKQEQKKSPAQEHFVILLLHEQWGWMNFLESKSSGSRIFLFLFCCRFLTYLRFFSIYRSVFAFYISVQISKWHANITQTKVHMKRTCLRGRHTHNKYTHIKTEMSQTCTHTNPKPVFPACVRNDCQEAGVSHKPCSQETEPDNQIETFCVRAFVSVCVQSRRTLFC